MRVGSSKMRPFSCIPGDEDPDTHGFPHRSKTQHRSRVSLSQQHHSGASGGTGTSVPVPAALGSGGDTHGKGPIPNDLHLPAVGCLPSLRFHK